MQDSKLVQLFLTFSGYELANLRKFVQSPYHNQREDVQLLFEFLAKQHSKKRPNYDREAAWAYCYGNETPFHNPMMCCLMTFLLQTIEQFLCAEELAKKDIVQQNVYLSRIYARLELPIHAHQNFEQWGKNLATKTQAKDSQFLYRCYEYEHSKYSSLVPKHRKTDGNLQTCVDTLDQQFIAEKLRQACELLAQQNIRKTQYQWGLLEFILPYIAQHQARLLQQPAIALYYYYYQAITQQSEAFFELYTQQLLSIKQEFRRDELRNLYRMAINYSIRRSNLKDNELYIRETWILYLAALDKGILLENNTLSRFSYKNMVSLAVRIRELNWVNTFITNYTRLLEPKFQKTYESYARGKWSFAKKEYQQALSYLQEVEFEDVFLSLDVRVILLKIYYELDEYDVLESFLQSFKMFLLRQKRKLGYHYDNYKNIVRCTNQLMNVQYAREKINHLREKIKTIPTLTEREWLLAQLDKL